LTTIVKSANLNKITNSVEKKIIGIFFFQWKLYAYAAVLPVPVGAAPMTLRPASVGGMHAICTAVGFFNPNSASVHATALPIPSD
jgi:hypothetical protein